LRGVSCLESKRNLKFVGYFDSMWAMESQRRVSLQVATLEYIRSKTTVPIPQVYHYESNQYNELEAEYIIMSKVWSARPLSPDTCLTDFTGFRSSPIASLPYYGHGRTTTIIIQSRVTYAHTVQTPLQCHRLSLFI
jgi:hypothetical protein